MEKKDLGEADSLGNGEAEKINKEQLGKGEKHTACNGYPNPADYQKVIHQLEVYRIELKVQNEELKWALKKATTATSPCDFSPSGYFTLENNGTILELNHNGARMLGKERAELVYSNFMHYISPETMNIFQTFLKKAVESDTKQNCEVRLIINEASSISVYLEGFVSIFGQTCLVTAIDHTASKKAQEAVLLSESRLKRAELVSKTGNWELHVDSQKIFASDGAIKIYGLDENTFDYSDIKKAIIQQYRPYLDRALNNLIEGNLPYDVEFKIIAKDTGEIKDIHSLATFDQEKRILFGVIQDVTERKRMEDRIHESEQYYRTMVETSPDAIVILNPSGHLQFASKRAIEIFFLPTDNPIGNSFIEWISPEMRELTAQRFTAILSGKINPELYEYKITRKDGTTVWTEIRGSLLQDAEGKINGIFLICRDVTQRKLADEALQQAHDELKHLHDNLDEAIFSFDPVHNKMLQASKAHETIFGYKPSEFFKNPHLWYDIIIPEDKHIADAGFPILLSGKNLKHEFRIVRPDGQLRWVASRMQPTLDKDGKLIQIDGIAYDITQRKQAEEAKRISEEKFRMVFENVFDGIAIYHEDIDPFKRTLIECNERYAAMAGRSREELLRLGNTQALQITLEDSANNKRLESISLKKAFQGSYSWIRPDGKKNVIEYIGVPIIWGGKSFAIGIDRDITLHKQAEADLIAAKEKAEESDRLKSAFLANMSHEIRTPLNSIIGFSELMSDPDFDMDQAYQFAQIINTSGNNLLSIISDIMDISKIEAGHVELNKHLFSVNKLILDLQKEYCYKAHEKGIELRLDPSNPIEEVIIESDQIKLRQILVNLVGNSIKFTEKGFIEIGLRLTSNDLVFHVKDTGIGISDEYQTQIFERFRQVESTYTRKYGGTGLGLAISKSLTELLGGMLWLESEKGKGSTFYFTIPIGQIGGSHQL